MKIISVVMATYNGINFIEEQLNSIMNQTLLPNEIVIQDDLSTDGTYEFVLNYAKNNPKIKWKIRKNDNNLGYKKNFYEAICNSDGDYIFLCDQDDIWLKEKIEKMIGTMEKNPNISLLLSNIKSFYQDNCKHKVYEEYFGLKKIKCLDKINHCVNTPRPRLFFLYKKRLN